MMSFLAHFTPHEFPVGLLLFVAGLATGVGVAWSLRFLRTR